MTGQELADLLFEQFEQEVTSKRAAARRLNERQRLEEEEHGNENEVTS